MKTSKSMQSIITKIAARHGLDLTQLGGHLRLTMPGMLPLVIETLPDQMVSVAHYYTQNGDAMRDPEVVFYTGWYEWAPIEITQDPTGNYRHVCKPEGPDAWVLPAEQADLASFVRVWAKNIREQGWLNYGEIAQ